MTFNENNEIRTKLEIIKNMKKLKQEHILI